MAYNRFQVDNFFVTTISSDQTLTPGVDWILNLVNVPNIEDGKIFFVVFRVNNPATRIVIPVYMDWWSVKYKWYNLTEVIELFKYDEVAINDLAENFNTIFELTDDIWKVVKKWGLDILVYWWDLIKGNEQIILPDTDITLEDNKTLFIIFDYSDDTLKAVETLPWAYYHFATIVTSWWEITSVSWRRAFNVQDFFSALFFEKDANWEVIIKDEAIKWLQIDFTSFDADDIFQWATHLFLTPAERVAIAANTSARHTHSNKSLLDTYTVSNAQIVDAVAKAHAHANKSTLDLIPTTVWVPDNYVMKKVWSTIIWWPGGWSGWVWTAAYTDIFVWDWVNNTFLLSHTPLNDDLVFMTNDSWQTYFSWIDYSRVGQEITFVATPDAWRLIYIKYFEQADITQVWETNTMLNLPWSWVGVYKQKSWVQFQMRRVRWINGITVTQVWDELVVDWHISVWPWGEANTASNVWVWIWLFKLKSWVDLQFKTISWSSTINIIENDDDISVGVNQAWLNKNYYRHFMY